LLLEPSWLLSGHTLTIEGTAIACGRDGVLVSAVPAGYRGLNRRTAQRWRRSGRYTRASVVVDAALVHRRPSLGFASAPAPVRLHIWVFD
jgi:hypothetical protein